MFPADAAVVSQLEIREARLALALLDVIGATDGGLSATDGSRPIAVIQKSIDIKNLCHRLAVSPGPSSTRARSRSEYGRRGLAAQPRPGAIRGRFSRQ